jgi:hypothetical protein
MKPSETQETLSGALFLLTPVLLLYASLVILAHKRRHAADFVWKLELLFFLLPLLVLARYFFRGLMLIGFAWDAAHGYGL